MKYRDVAQLGSAPAWGAGGRWFESSRPDHSTIIIKSDIGVQKKLSFITLEYLIPEG